jgi:hypothetical protein
MISNHRMNIIFNKIDVNTIDTASGIFIGTNHAHGWSSHNKNNNENVQNGWDTHSKNNFGQGTVYGNTISSNNINSISDNDIIDTPINDQDYKPSIKTGS